MVLSKQIFKNSISSTTNSKAFKTLDTVKKWSYNISFIKILITYLKYRYTCIEDFQRLQSVAT